MSIQWGYARSATRNSPFNILLALGLWDDGCAHEVTARVDAFAGIDAARETCIGALDEWHAQKHGDGVR